MRGAYICYGYIVNGYLWRGREERSNTGILTLRQGQGQNEGKNEQRQGKKQIPPLRCGMTNKLRSGMTNKEQATAKAKCGDSSLRSE
jgi:hypothetical protein